MIKKVLYLLTIALFFGLTGNINADYDIEWERIPMPSNQRYANSTITAVDKYLFLSGAGINRLNTQTGIWDTTSYPINANALIGSTDSKDIYSIGNPLPMNWPRYLFKSTDYGVTWDTLSRVTSYTYGKGIVRNNGQLIVLKRDAGPIVSIDSGRTWQFSPHDTINSSSVCDLEMDKGGVVYLATINFFGSVAGVYRSYDTCRTWIGPNAQNGTCALTVDQGDRVYLGFAGGPIYYSDNQAASWINTGFGGLLGARSLFTASDGTIFAGLGSNDPTPGGVLCSFDRGVTWQRRDSGLSESRSVYYFTEDAYKYVYMYEEHYYTGEGDSATLYRTKNPVGITDKTEIKIKDYELANYPNPFNNSTVISYNLFIAGRVQLTVYNIKGEQVRNLLNEYQSSGKHSIIFNADGLNSGVYFIKITVGDQTGVHKLILIK